MSEELRPEWWGCHIYEGAMGLHGTMEEAKKESWRGESHFPLYAKHQVDALSERIRELEKELGGCLLDKDSWKETLQLAIKNRDDALAAQKQAIADLLKERDAARKGLIDIDCDCGEEVACLRCKTLARMDELAQKGAK